MWSTLRGSFIGRTNNLIVRNGRKMRVHRLAALLLLMAYACGAAALNDEASFGRKLRWDTQQQASSQSGLLGDEFLFGINLGT